MPIFRKRATGRAPAAGPPEAAPERPIDDLYGDADAYACRAELDQGRWQRFHEFIEADGVTVLSARAPIGRRTWPTSSPPSAEGWPEITQGAWSRRNESSARKQPAATERAHSGSCLVERYGAAGPGLVGYEEYGLRNLTWEQVAAWRGRWFTAENAVLCLLGEVPAGLHIDLPHGQVLEMAAARPCPVQLPAFTVTGRGGIGLSLVGTEALANSVALDILQRRLTDELRHNRGLSYSVQSGTEHVDAHIRHTWLAADTLPEQAAMAAHVMLGTFGKLAGSGCTAEKLAGYSRRLRDTYQSPSGPVLIMHRQATQILFRQPPRDPGDTLRLVEQLACGDVASAADGLYQQMIVATPQLIPAVEGRMPRLPLWSATPVAGGVTYRRRDSTMTLTIADGGVMLTPEPGKFAAMHSDQIAALLKWYDDKLTVIGTDGFALPIDPAEWDGAGEALQVFANRTDPDLVVTIDAPGPTGGKPAAAPDPPPAGPDPPPAGPAPAPARRKPRVARWLPWIVLVAWIVALAVASLAIGFDYRFAAFLFVVALGSRIVPQAIRRRKH